MSQLFFRIFLNSKEIGCNASGGTDLLPRARLCKQENKFPSLKLFIYAASRRYGPDYTWIFPPQWMSTSNDFFLRKNLSQVYIFAWVYKHHGTLFTLVCVCGACSLKNRASDSLELELQLFVSCSLSQLGI